MEKPAQAPTTEHAGTGPAFTVKNVVTVFISYHGRILLLRRGDKVGSYRGRWAGISGYIDENEESIKRALKEISEEVQLDSNAVALVKTGQSFPALDEDVGILFVVHPFLFSTTSPKITLDWEHDAFRWIRSQDLSRFETVPKLRESLERVLDDTPMPGPPHPAVLARLTEIKEDRVNGASELSRRALMAMSTLAKLASAATQEDLLFQLRVFGRELMNSRPSMAPLTNLAGRLLYLVEAQAGTARTVEELRQLITVACHQLVEESQRAVREIAAHAFHFIHNGMTVFTHSRSATVYETFKVARSAGISVSAIVTESRPLFEGRTTARELSALGVPVTLTVDSAGGQVMRSADLCVVGADSVLSDGSVINKIGTFPLALSAREYDKPFYVLCEKSKFNLRSLFEHRCEMEERETSEVLPYAPDALVTVKNPYFEKTPSRLISKLITEDGGLTSEELPPLFRKMLRGTYL